MVDETAAAEEQSVLLHSKASKNILRYLQGNVTLGILFKKLQRLRHSGVVLVSLAAFRSSKVGPTEAVIYIGWWVAFREF